MLHHKHHRGALNVECRQYSTPAGIKSRFSSHSRNRKGTELVVICYLSVNKVIRRDNVLLPVRWYDSESKPIRRTRGRTGRKSWRRGYIAPGALTGILSKGLGSSSLNQLVKRKVCRNVRMSARCNSQLEILHKRALLVQNTTMNGTS